MTIERLESAHDPRGPYVRYGVHCTTPISSVSCHWWWAYIENHNRGIDQPFQERIGRVLEQDKHVLEAIQTTISQDVHGNRAPEALLTTDRTSAAVRRLIIKMVEEEARLRGCTGGVLDL